MSLSSLATIDVAPVDELPPNSVKIVNAGSITVSISLSPALNRLLVSGFSSGQGTARGNDPSRLLPK